MTRMLAVVAFSTLSGCACRNPGPVDSGPADASIVDSGIPLDGGAEDSGVPVDAGCRGTRGVIDRVFELGLSASWAWTRGRGGAIGVKLQTTTPIGVRVIEITDGGPTIRDATTQLVDLVFVDGDGNRCGSTIGPSGVAQLAIEQADGGFYRSGLEGTCFAYNSGWWVTRSQQRVYRSDSANVSMILPDPSDGGFETPVDVSADGTVLVQVQRPPLLPVGFLLPGLIEINGSAGEAYPQLLSDREVWGVARSSTGLVPTVWNFRGESRVLATPVDVVNATFHSVHRDGRACATLYRSSGDELTFWSETGASAGVSTLDAGSEIVECSEVLDDGWIAAAVREGQVIRPLLFHLIWECE